MASFWFGAKEPQRDFGLDPGSWNETVFLWIIFSGQGPIPQGLQQILMASFWFGAKEPQRDFGLDPGSWNETFLFESYFQRRDPFHTNSPDLLFFRCYRTQRDFGLDPASWSNLEQIWIFSRSSMDSPLYFLPFNHLLMSGQRHLGRWL